MCNASAKKLCSMSSLQNFNCVGVMRDNIDAHILLFYVSCQVVVSDRQRSKQQKDESLLSHASYPHILPGISYMYDVPNKLPVSSLV